MPTQPIAKCRRLNEEAIVHMKRLFKEKKEAEDEQLAASDDLSWWTQKCAVLTRNLEAAENSRQAAVDAHKAASIKTEFKTAQIVDLAETMNSYQVMICEAESQRATPYGLWANTIFLSSD